MAENSTIEYENELYEVLDDKGAQHFEQVYVVYGNENGEHSDIDDSDEQFEEEGNLSMKI